MTRRPFAGGMAIRLSAPQARVDVLPLVNLFLSLVPFLLLCATFAPLAAAQVEAAGHASQKGGGLVLRIRPTSFAIESGSKQASTYVGRPVDPDNGARGGFDLLTDACLRIKTRLPDSHTLTIIPGDDVPYEDVIATLDALRQSRVFADLVLGSTAASP